MCAAAGDAEDVGVRRKALRLEEEVSKCALVCIARVCACAIERIGEIK